MQICIITYILNIIGTNQSGLIKTKKFKHHFTRILAELRTRAFMVLSLEVKDPSFADAFLSYNCEVTESMSAVAHLCTPGQL